MKISVHAIPHQSFLSIGSEVPIDKKSSFPPGEAKGIVRIRPGFYKAVGACRETPQSALTGCQLPPRGAKGIYSPVPMRILARAELASRMTVFSVPVRLFFRASRARVNS